MKRMLIVLGFLQLSANVAQSEPLGHEGDGVAISIPGKGMLARRDRNHIRIESISTGAYNQPVLITIGGQEYEVSPFTQIGGSWVAGQKVKLSPGQKSSYYDTSIENLDNGEAIKARRVEPKPKPLF